jgi:bifunctional non-homologous end joining protein LigD
MLVRISALPRGFIEPCNPTPSKSAPAGSQWVHEIKHDGYRLLVRKQGDRVRIFTRRGYDWTKRYPRIVETAKKLKVDSVAIDGPSGVLKEKSKSYDY